MALRVCISNLAKRHMANYYACTKSPWTSSLVAKSISTTSDWYACRAGCYDTIVEHVKEQLELPSGDDFEIEAVHPSTTDLPFEEEGTLILFRSEGHEFDFELKALSFTDLHPLFLSFTACLYQPRSKQTVLQERVNDLIHQNQALTKNKLCKKNSLARRSFSL